MLKLLLKKQLLEVFKSYFYNAKKNVKRSRLAVACWFIFFAVLMVGVLGGMFTFLSITLCGALTGVGMGWLYFALMGGISILLGAFGSVFNTYSSLYLPKDNDLLLSMPVPVSSIIAARLMNVWLMGAMYASVVIVPALIVYWATVGATAGRILCGILLLIIITVIVLVLSTLLGWVVARISLKLKNKSFITVLVSLLFIAAYYFFYFKANDLIRDLILNIQIYGARIRGTSHGIYLFGRIGEGSWPAAALFLAVSAALIAGVWLLLSGSFLAIATSGSNTRRIRYREKATRVRSPSRALLGREFLRFTSSPNYMLNCGFGILLIPASGILLLIRGQWIINMLKGVFVGKEGCISVLICAALCLLSCMNDMAAPSVSLEGKSLWIPQSMPVEPKAVLRAKACMQWLLTGIPMLFAVLCAAAVLRTPAVEVLFICLTPLLFTAFFALFSTFLAVKLPILRWTTEIAPIKQSASVAIALFGGWILSIALGALYFLIGVRLGAAVYLAIWAVLFAAAALILLHWLDTQGSRAFARLS